MRAVQCRRAAPLPCTDADAAGVLERHVLIVIVGRAGGEGDALEQALGDFGLEWTVRWVDDAEALFALPTDTPIDVVVAGHDVPATPAHNLLKLVRQFHPQAVRILLVDDADGGARLHALDGAHRLLRRPLDVGELIEAVESVAELRELLADPALQAAIARVGTLPPPPRLYIELTQLLADPETDAGDIAETISQDPVTAAKVLRLCNSAYFSAGRVVTDVRTAVVRLGQETVRRLVLATEAFGNAPGDADREGLQDRALRTSTLAAQVLPGTSADLAATAGLLAEVGRLLPGVAVDEEGVAAGLPHYADAGAYLLGLWGLPMPIVEAVAHHRAPSRIRQSGFWVGGAVHVASALVTGSAVDEAYLQAVGVAGELPRWRALAQEAALAA